MLVAAGARQAAGDLLDGIGAGAVEKAAQHERRPARRTDRIGHWWCGCPIHARRRSLLVPRLLVACAAQRRAELKIKPKARAFGFHSLCFFFLVSSPPVPVLLLSPDHLAAFPSFLSCFRTSDRWCSRPFRGRWLAPLSPSFCYQWPSISPLLSLPFTYSSCSLPTPSPATCPENSAPLAPIAPQKSKPTCTHCIRMTRPVGGAAGAGGFLSRCSHARTTARTEQSTVASWELSW